MCEFTVKMNGQVIKKEDVTVVEENFLDYLNENIESSKQVIFDLLDYIGISKIVLIDIAKHEKHPLYKIANKVLTLGIYE